MFEEADLESPKVDIESIKVNPMLQQLAKKLFLKPKSVSKFFSLLFLFFEVQYPKHRYSTEEGICDEKKKFIDM